MKPEEKTLKSKLIYKGKILDFFVDDVLVNKKVKSTREYLKQIYAVAVLLKVGNKFILEKQFRYPNKEITIEVPAGKGNKNETPINCAKREVQEETGYKINKIKSLGYYLPACAYTTEKIYLYYAEASKKEETNFDEDEYIEIKEYSLDQIIKLIMTNKISDSKTIVILFKYLHKYVKQK